MVKHFANSLVSALLELHLIGTGLFLSAEMHFKDVIVRKMELNMHCYQFVSYCILRAGVQPTLDPYAEALL